jgi:hypothetical protein
VKHAKAAKPVVEPVEMETPATPLPTAQTAPEPEAPATVPPTPTESPGMTAEPLNHMGRIMQMAPHDDFAPPRAKPVTPEETNTEDSPATNDAPMSNGPSHDTTP